MNAKPLSGSQWLFSGTQMTQKTSYKINNYNTLELPITLNYNLGRIAIFGGINLAYAFPISWSKETAVNSVTVEYSGNKNPFTNTPAVLDESKAFAAKAGLGYLLGMNYDFSRKVSLDARITQILADNAKGQTDAINRLFKMPNLQLSIGFYLGRKEKVTYIMDRK